MSKLGAHDLVTMEMKCPLSGNLDPHGLDHIPQGMIIQLCLPTDTPTISLTQAVSSPAAIYIFLINLQIKVFLPEDKSAHAF